MSFGHRVADGEPADGAAATMWRIGLTDVLRGQQSGGQLDGVGGLNVDSAGVTSDATQLVCGQSVDLETDG